MCIFLFKKLLTYYVIYGNNIVNERHGGDKMKDKIKKLTELMKEFGKLMAEVLKLLTQITLAEMAVKTIIQIIYISIIYIPIWTD